MPGVFYFVKLQLVVQHHQRDAITHPKYVEQPRNVAFDGSLRHAELVCYFLVRPTHHDATQDRPHPRRDSPRASYSPGVAQAIDYELIDHSGSLSRIRSLFHFVRAGLPCASSTYRQPAFRKQRPGWRERRTFRSST